MVGIIFRDQRDIDSRGRTFICSLDDNPDLCFNQLHNLKKRRLPVVIDNTHYKIIDVRTFRGLFDNRKNSKTFQLTVKRDNT